MLQDSNDGDAAAFVDSDGAVTDTARRSGGLKGWGLVKASRLMTINRHSQSVQCSSSLSCPHPRRIPKALTLLPIGGTCDSCSEPIGGWDSNTNLSDGSWHHVALTTWPNGPRGYRLYIDGLLAGDMPSDSQLWGE